ncbi:ATP-binding cassette domain-containing protein [Micromonospora sp. M12]
MPPRHGAARRRLGLQRRRRRPDRRRGGAADGRPGRLLALPEAGRRAAGHPARGPWADPGRRLHRCVLHRPGREIVALAGLVGAGRSEVARAIFGVDRYDAGRCWWPAAPSRRKPGRAIAAGMALVPEDRRQQGLVMELSVERNATLARRRALSRLGLLLGGAERAEALHWTRRLQVKASRLGAPVATLSGGNQQKVVLAKWLATEPRVLIIDEPTRGIDVGTKAEVHRLLSELAGEGLAILMISSELPEVLGMADRVLVMHEGRLVRELPRPRRTKPPSCSPRPVKERPHEPHRRRRARTGRRERPTDPGRQRHSRTERLLAVRELSLLIALGLLVLVTTVRNDRFLSGQSIRTCCWAARSW